MWLWVRIGLHGALMRCGPLHVALCRSFWAMLMNSWRRSSKFWFAFAPLYCMSYFSYLFKESKFGSIDFFSIIFNCIDFCSVFKIIFFILLAFGLFCSFSSGYLRCKLKLLILDSSSFSVLACVCVCVCVCELLSHVWFFATPWTTPHQAPLSMGFSRQEHWSDLLFHSPSDSAYNAVNFTSSPKFSVCVSDSVVSNSLRAHGL